MVNMLRLVSASAVGSGMTSSVNSDTRIFVNCVGLVCTLKIALVTLGGAPPSYVPSAINNQLLPLYGAIVS